MKFLILIPLILAIFGCVQAGDKKCTMSGKTFSEGQTYQPPGKCEIYECFGNNRMIGKSCPSEDSLKPCKYIPQDNSKPYPRCCPRYEC